MTIKELAKQKPQSLIGKAYAFSEKAHAGQKRQSGEPYFDHTLQTAEILHEWQLDEATIVAGLLHDIVEDTTVSLDDLKKGFGDEIVFLVDGVTKLGHVKYRGAENKAENLKKMILALSEDLRVVFIKLADRLHNMRTLGALPPMKQKRIALETDEIYASLAYRLGMHNLSGELRDLAFPYLHPEEEKWIKKNVRDLYEAREQYLKKITPVLEEMLKKNSLKALVIDYRAKRYSSLYQKLLRHDMDIEKIYDLVALRIIMDTVTDCYAALGVLHQLWPPLPGRIKDYIAMPKPNGYRSLHTTVIGPEEKAIEIQIRTKEMHEENENGIAAHWLYQHTRGTSKSNKRAAQKMTEELPWVQQLRGWQEKYRESQNDPEKIIDSMKVDFFKDRIFAISPRGDVIDLPVGSTPIDFAYHIHTQIGDSCVGAKVNGQFVALNHPLRSGDVVLILTQKNKKPSEDWLKFVKTAVAKNHIKTALRGKHHALRERKPTKTEFRIVVEDRVGLIKDISTVIAQSHVNIVSVATNTSPGSRFPMDKIQCEITDPKKIEKLILKLKKIKGVREVSHRLVI